MYRVPAISVLLAAAAFPPSLAGQMRTVPRAISPAQVTGQRSVARFQGPPPSAGLGGMSARLFGRRVSLVRSAHFPDNLRFRISFGNTCFTDPFFDPILCQQLLSRNQFSFAQPVFFPFPGYSGPYYQVAEQNGPTVADREGDLSREVDRLTNEVELLRAPAPEPLLLEWHGDHWVRVTSYGQSATGAEPDSSQRSQGRSAPPEPNSTRQSPRELPPVALVFRDGRKQEVSSYTIVGGTMYTRADYWTSGSWTKEIRITDLDLPATLRLNQERGVKFALPAEPYEVVIR
jgi:hypothetical protein